VCCEELKRTGKKRTGNSLYGIRFVKVGPPGYNRSEKFWGKTFLETDFLNQQNFAVRQDFSFIFVLNHISII